MKKIVLLSVIIIMGCEDAKQKLIEENQLIFVASEGNYGSSNGSISVFRNGEKIQKLENIGDVLQSIVVHNNKLIVALNNSHFLKFYEITINGLLFPGIEISTDNSSPREMVVLNNKLYFTNWNSKDIKVLNLETYAIESSIPIDGLPEDIVTDGTHLWISVPNLELYDTNNGSSIVKIDIASEEILESYEVGNGPQHMVLDEHTLWISRTFYDPSWTAFYGSSRIDLLTGEVTMLDYGAGAVCGGDMMKISGEVYRTYEGGVAPLEMDLSLNSTAKIGSYKTLYSAGAHQNTVFLGISDYTAPDTVLVHNEIGQLTHTYIVGTLPGDYQVWKKN